MLKQIPNENDLARICFELASLGARCVGKKRAWPYPKMNRYELLTLAAEMSRFAPRLFGIVVEYFIESWKEINPVKLRAHFSSMETPQIFAVIGEFLKTACGNPEVTYYFNHLTSGLKPIPLQFFFHGLYQVGGRLAQRAIESPLSEYKRWGFLACERPTLNTISKKSLGSLDTSSRLNILRNLLKKRGVIKISDYLKLLNHSISRQQALLDLKRCESAVKTGRGRGVQWKLAA